LLGRAWTLPEETRSLREAGFASIQSDDDFLGILPGTILILAEKK